MIPIGRRFNEELLRCVETNDAMPQIIERPYHYEGGEITYEYVLPLPFSDIPSSSLSSLLQSANCADVVTADSL